jgi:hypothetical protein
LCEPAPLDPLDAEPHEPVVDQHVVAGLEDRAEHGGADREVAVGGRVLARDHHVRAPRQLERLPEVADAQLRALEVADQRHRPPGRLLRVSDPASPFGDVGMLAVREVEAGAVHPRLDEVGDRLRRGRCGPDRGDDLRPADVVAHRGSA